MQDWLQQKKAENMLNGTLKLAVILASGLLTPCVRAEPGEEYRSLLEKSEAIQKTIVFADNMMEHGRDAYGPKHTPLFVIQLDVQTRRIPASGKGLTIGRYETTDNPHGNDFYWDAGLVRLLDALTVITGDPQYRQATSDYIAYALEHCRMTIKGRKYLAAGDHACYMLTSDKMSGNNHELRGVRLPWDRMHEVNPRSPPMKSMVSTIIFSIRRRSASTGIILRQAHHSPCQAREGPTSQRGRSCIAKQMNRSISTGLAKWRLSTGTGVPRKQVSR